MEEENECEPQKREVKGRWKERGKEENVAEGRRRLQEVQRGG